MTSKLIEALNKCETQKSYENVRYTLVDDELRAYIEESLERFEPLKKENKELKEFQVLTKQGLWNLQQENEKLKKEKEELSQAYDLLNKTLHIVIDCITNATELNQLKIDIMNKIKNEVLNND